MVSVSAAKVAAENPSCTASNLDVLAWSPLGFLVVKGLDAEFLEEGL
jgi:hypothetical protein